jgi:phosphoribosyl-ATP pyrophosphohydrolase/phosphoribosyl-AMP cyclohydrolase
VQKVGEEAVEVVIEGKNGNNERLLDESSDLLFHLMVLWESRELSLDDVAARLKGRSRETAT